MRFHGSKALILFTRRLTPAELRLQSDRGTQKSEIYFTDYTLTGQPDGFASESQDCEWGRGVLLVKPLHGLANFFHRLHFGWTTGCIPLPRVRAAIGGAWGKFFGEALLCKALANFISPITLWLDNRMLSPPKSQSCGGGPGASSW